MSRQELITLAVTCLWNKRYKIQHDAAEIPTKNSLYSHYK